MSQTLFRFGLPVPPICDGYVDEFGARHPCFAEVAGTSQCGACEYQGRQERRLRERHLTERLQRETHGPAPDGVDPFRGFREE